MFAFMLMVAIHNELNVIFFYHDCQVSLKVPVVVRLEGTNVDQGKRILKVANDMFLSFCYLVLFS